MRSIVLLFTFSLGVCFVAAPARAAIITIPLNDINFFADPPSAVEFAVDGSSVLMREDSLFSPVFLSNDPGLGDPPIIVAGSGVLLSFQYEFVKGMTQVENDEFGAFVVNSAGISAGPMFEFFTSTSGSGSVTFDLSSLLGEPFLGLQFQLSSLPGDVGLDSIVTISDLQLDVPGSTVVPEPSTLAMFLGLAAFSQVVIAGRRRRCRRQSFQTVPAPVSR